MREVQIQTGVQKNHRKVSDSVDADSFVIIKEQREQTQQQGDETKEQAKGRPKAREKGKTKDKSRGRGGQLARPGNDCRGSRRTWAAASVSEQRRRHEICTSSFTLLEE